MSKGTLLLVSLALVLSSCRTTAASNSNEKIIDESLTDVDLFKPGAFPVTEHEYDSGPLSDGDVLQESHFKDVKTDVRGRIFLPVGKGAFPLVVFLHGNHPTCGVPTGEGNPRLDRGAEFTTTGLCPPGSIEVPSYRGYDESARLLASWGYVVASINANRGITGGTGLDAYDSHLVYARGNLVLRHIEELARWSNDGTNPSLKAEGIDLKGKSILPRLASWGIPGVERGCGRRLTSTALERLLRNGRRVFRD